MNEGGDRKTAPAKPGLLTKGHLKPEELGAEILRACSTNIMCHVSCVMCHVSPVI